MKNFLFLLIFIGSLFAQNAQEAKQNPKHTSSKQTTTKKEPKSTKATQSKKTNATPTLNQKITLDYLKSNPLGFRVIFIFGCFCSKRLLHKKQKKLITLRFAKMQNFLDCILKKEAIKHFRAKQFVSE